MFTRIFLLVVLLVSVISLPALANPGDDEFAVTYRFEEQQASANNESGYLLINVMNIGARSVKDLSVWVIDAADPTLPHIPVQIGDLEPGFSREVLEIPAAANLLPGDEPKAAAQWHIEYTDTAGEKHQLDVVGQIGI